MKITEADLKAAFVAGANWEAQKDDPYMSWASNIKEAFLQHMAARTAYKARIAEIEKAYGLES